MNKENPKIMLHFVNYGKTGGPNIVFQRIKDSGYLKSKYNFVDLFHKIGSGPKFDIKEILNLIKSIKRERPDIVHIAGMQSAGFHCMLAAFLAGTRNRIVTTHGFSADDLRLSVLKKIILKYIMEPLTLVLATKVIGISKFTLNNPMVQKLCKNKSTYIYNMPPDLKNLRQEEYIRNEFKISKKDILCTVVSRIVYDKGFRTLANAINVLSSKNEFNNIKFLIVGDGSYENEFKKLIYEHVVNNKVIFTGKRNDVINILKESDIFVLPTLHENLGNVFIEAMTVNLPCIGSNVGGVPEVIDDKKTGLLVTLGDHLELANAILELSSNEILRREMGKNGKIKVESQFSIQTISEQYDLLYKGIIEKIK